ncbi:LADA_0B09582g1_1 [Lachancea dasiensis]|uniref:LADA_0B09582g1_1 n=1 Tax=Lachancea dasiensis TaxID=1072105 RepID=A0A1G4IVH4_9SACH|nr:LADA_0B09582g1_1 [Lachancea dasiensis]
MRPRSLTESDGINARDFKSWRVYQVNNQLYLGSVGSKSSRACTLCLSNLTQTPFVVKFDAEDVNKQALAQGIVVRASEGIFSDVVALLKDTTSQCQMLSQENCMTFKSVLYDNVEVKLTLPMASVGELDTLLIYQGTSKCLFKGLELQYDIVNGLRAIIRQKEQALSFLEGSIRDLGFGNVVDKWSPPLSMNNEVLQTFNYGSWVSNWSNKSVDHQAYARSAGDFHEMINVLFKKATGVQKLGFTDRMDEESIKSSNSDDFESQRSGGSVAEKDAPQVEQMSTLKRNFDEHLTGLNSKVGFEASSVSETLSKIGEDSKHPPARSESQDESNLTVDQSPSKRRRKFGKIRAEPK